MSDDPDTSTADRHAAVLTHQLLASILVQLREISSALRRFQPAGWKMASERPGPEWRYGAPPADPKLTLPALIEPHAGRPEAALIDQPLLALWQQRVETGNRILALQRTDPQSDEIQPLYDELRHLSDAILNTWPQSLADIVIIIRLARILSPSWGVGLEGCLDWLTKLGASGQFGPAGPWPPEDED